MNPMRGILVLDIETVSNPLMSAFVTPPDPVTVSDAPKNYKKESVITGWIEKEIVKRQAAYDERLAKMPLDIDYAMVDSIGWQVVVGQEATLSGVALRSEEFTESDVLRAFWKVAASADRLAGYNIMGFDLPILYRRSWVLGVETTRFRARRYSSEDVIDVMQLLYNWGNGPGPRARSLKVVCAMYGIDNPLPDLDGSQYEGLSPDERREYCANDVRMTWELLQKIHLIYWR